MKHRDRIRVTLDLTSKQHARLGALEEKTGATSKAEVLRKAFCLYEHMVNECATGAQIISRAANGKERVLIFTEMYID